MIYLFVAIVYFLCYLFVANLFELIFFPSNSVLKDYWVLIYINLVYFNYFLLLFNWFLNNYWRPYRWIKFVGIFQRVGKKLLQISLLLFNYWWNCIRSFCQLYVKFSKRNTNIIKRIIYTLFSLANPSIILLLTYSPIPEITDESFTNGVFLSMSPSVKIIPMD